MTGITYWVKEIFGGRRFYKLGFIFLVAVTVAMMCSIFVTSDMEKNSDKFEIIKSIQPTDEPVIIDTRADEGCPAGGAVNGNQEYSCGSACHNVQSVSNVVLSSSYQTLSPGDTITVSVRVTGAETDSTPLGVFLVTSLSSEMSQPRDEGWEILSDPGGSTSYNYYLKDAVYGGGAWTWTLKAPENPGTYYLYAREHHGNGQKYWQENTNGLKFDVIERESSGSGLLILLYVFMGLIMSVFAILIVYAIRKHDSSKKAGQRDSQDLYEDGETMIECPKCGCSLKAKNRNRHERRCTIRRRY